MKIFPILLLVLLSTSVTAADIEVFGAEETRRENLPFSEAVAVGDLLFVSGQIGRAPGTPNLVTGGVQAETRQAMQNIITILRKYGSDVKKIAKCTIFLRDMNEWALMNVAYLEALGDHRPARSALGASGLALGGSVEIECIAAR
ncbi:MAG: RidA family protein [Oceanicoccus sp.]